MKQYQSSSYDFKKNEPNCRFVNLKFIIDDEWIFFSNYLSQRLMNLIKIQILLLLFGKILIVKYESKQKFARQIISFLMIILIKDEAKNILAITSKQSKIIASYDDFLDVYDKSMKSITNPRTRPEY